MDGKGDDVEATSADAPLEHLNLFPLEESSEKKGNEEYLKEKKEEKVSALILLSWGFHMRIYFWGIKQNLLMRLKKTFLAAVTSGHQL